MRENGNEVITGLGMIHKIQVDNFPENDYL